MKLRNLLQRTAAAAVAGAMALSLSAPALAAVPELPVGRTLQAGISQLEAENDDEVDYYGITVTYDGTTYHVNRENAGNILSSDNAAEQLTYLPNDPKDPSKGGKLVGGNAETTSDNDKVSFSTGMTISIDSTTAGSVDIELTGGKKGVIETQNPDTDFVINGAHDVTLRKNISGSADSGARYGVITCNAEITCSGDVVIKNETASSINDAVQSVLGNLTVNADGNVTIEGILSGGADITATGGDVTLHCGNGSAVREDKQLIVTGAANVKVSAESASSVVKTVTLNNCGTAVFENTWSSWKSAIPADGSLTVNSDTATYYAGDSENEATQKDSADECLGESYVKVEMQAAATDYGITVTYKDGTPVAVTSANADNVLGDDDPSIRVEKTTDAEGTAIYKLTGSDVNSSLKIDVNGAALPVDVELTQGRTGAAVCGAFTAEGVRNVTATNNSGTPAITGTATIDCSGDVNITNEFGIAVNALLTITKAKNVTVTGGAHSPALVGGADITCSGVVTIKTGYMAIANSNLYVNYDKEANTAKGTPAEGVVIESSGTSPAISGSAFLNSKIVSFTGPNDAAINHQAVTGSLKVYGAENIKVHTAYDAPALGQAEIHCSNAGTVELINDNYMVVNGALSVDGAKNITVEGKISGSIINGTVTFTNVQNGDVKLINEEGHVTSYPVLIDGAHNVTVTGGSGGGPVLSGGADITCSGVVTIKTGYMVTSGSNLYVNYDKNNNTAKGAPAEGVMIESSGNSPAISGSAFLNSKNVSFTGPNDTAINHQAVSGSLKVYGAENVKVHTAYDAPALGQAEIHCSNAGTVELINDNYMVVNGALSVDGAKNITVEGKISGSIINGAVTFTNVQNGDVKLINESGMVVYGLLSIDGADNVTVYGEYSNAPILAGGAVIDCSGNVEITNTSGFAVNNNLTVNGAKDVTVKANNNAPAINGSATITSSGDVTIENAGTGKAVNNLTYTNTGSEKALRLDGKFIEMLSDGVSGSYNASRITIRKEYRVTVTNGELSSGDNVFYAGQEVTVTAHDENASFSKFVKWKVIDAPDGFTLSDEQQNTEKMTFTMPEGAVELKAIYSIPSITMDVPVIVTDGTINDGTENPLLVKPGTAITVKANKKDEPVQFHHWKVEQGTSEDFGLTEGSLGSETEAGTEEIHFIMPKGGVRLTAVYSVPAGVQKNYVTVDGGIGTATINGSNNAKAEVEIGRDVTVSAEVDQSQYPGMVFDYWEIVYPESFSQFTDEQLAELGLVLALDDAESSTTTFTMPKYPVTLVAHWKDGVEPGFDDPTDPDFGKDGSGAAGAIVAGAALGGAAIWGGYEITTRAILNDLLPEGAAIPANRGQLAALIWAEKGKPEPAAQPAFTDVADAGLAKAAQWCVEQGLLDAKDGKFDPDGWMPKYKTIEVWKKAFPKQ